MFVIQFIKLKLDSRSVSGLELEGTAFTMTTITSPMTPVIKRYWKPPHSVIIQNKKRQEIIVSYVNYDIIVEFANLCAIRKLVNYVKTPHLTIS